MYIPSSATDEKNYGFIFNNCYGLIVTPERYYYFSLDQLVTLKGVFFFFFFFFFFNLFQIIIRVTPVLPDKV